MSSGRCFTAKLGLDGRGRFRRSGDGGRGQGSALGPTAQRPGLDGGAAGRILARLAGTTVRCGVRAVLFGPVMADGVGGQSDQSVLIHPALHAGTAQIRTLTRAPLPMGSNRCGGLHDFKISTRSGLDAVKTRSRVEKSPGYSRTAGGSSGNAGESTPSEPELANGRT